MNKKDTNSTNCENKKFTKFKSLFWIVFIALVATTGFFIVKSSNNLVLQYESLNSATVKNFSTDISSSAEQPSNIHLARLNADLVNFGKQYDRAPLLKKTEIMSSLLKTTVERREKLLEMMKVDPQSALNNIINPDLIKTLPLDVQSLVEKKQLVKGKLDYRISEYFEEGRSEEEYFIDDTKTGKRFRVYPTKKIPAITGDSLTIEGFSLDSNLVADSKKITVDRKVFSFVSNSSQLSQASGGSTPVSKKVLVILFNWPDNQTQPVTVDQARQIFFTADNSVRNYYLDNTYNQLELIGKTNGIQGDVHGWYTISQNSTNCTTNSDSWANLAKNAAQSSGVDVSGYDFYVYVFPFNSSCNWGGKAQLGGANSWINGISLTRGQAIAHEIGHGLGRHHAGGYVCTQNGIRVPIGGTCVLSEYADKFSVMSGYNVIDNGAQRYLNMNAYHKGLTSPGLLSWVNSSQKQTINRTNSPDAVYTITPLTSNLTGVKSIQIPRSQNNQASEYYYLEYRTLSNSDVFEFNSLNNWQHGNNLVLIRVAPDYGVSDITKIIDMTPGSQINTSTDFQDAALMPGMTFSDSVNGIHIETIALNQNDAQVRVYFTGPSCTNVSPTVAVTPVTTDTAMAGTTLTYNVIISNNDNNICNPSTYNVTTSAPSGFIVSPVTLTTSSISPGSSGTYQINITSPNTAAVGNYNFTLSAQNSAAPSVVGTTSGIYKVITGDTTPPTISNVTPVNGSTISSSGNVTISANATDTSGVGNISIYLNGSLIKSCDNKTSCSIKKSASSFVSGQNTILITARDKSLNLNTSNVSITVTK